MHGGYLVLKIRRLTASNILKSPHPVDKSTHFVDLVIPEIPLIACKKNSIGKNVIEKNTT